MVVLLGMEGKGDHTPNGTSNQQVTNLCRAVMGWDDGMMVTAGR